MTVGSASRSRPLIGVYPTLSPSTVLRGRGQVAAGSAPYPFSEPGLRLTHLGRGAVWLALRALGLGPGRRLAMPSFHCGAEVDAARLAGVEVVFYRVAPSLEVDEDDLAKVAADVDAVYLISHFGFPMPARPSNVPVIEDVAHGMFSAGGDGLPLGTGADAAVFCPRKSLGVPDGGAVLVADRTPQPQPSGRPPAKGVARSVVSLLTGRAALSRHAAVRTPAVAALAKASRADAAAAEGRLTEAVIGEWGMEVADVERAASRPSRLTDRIVGGVGDVDRIRQRRRSNYEALADALAPLCPDAHRSLPPGVCPLYFPVRCGDRSAAIARLLGHGVRAIEIWPVAHPLLDRDRFAELDPLRRELLALPVHQDLEPWHVELVAAAAREVLRP